MGAVGLEDFPSFRPFAKSTNSEFEALNPTPLT